MSVKHGRSGGSTNGAGHSRLATVGVFALALTFAGCDELLEVSMPGDIDVGDLRDPGLATTLVLGAQNDFECAFSSFVMTVGGWWAGEMWDASTDGTIGSKALRHGLTYDAGGGTCPTQTPYLAIQIARNQAITAYGIVEGHPENRVPDKARLLATAAAYEGFSTIYLGEGYCEMRLDEFGPIISPNSVLEVAEQRFRTAIQHAQAAGAEDILNFARVGLARVLNRLNQHQEAKTVAQQVPEGFVRNATAAVTPGRRNNRVAWENNLRLVASVAEAYRNLEVDGIPDPRVPVVERPELSPRDGRTTIWTQELFPELGDPIPLATWQETRLIIAEAELDAGNTAAAVAAINVLRQHYDLPLYQGGSPAEVREQLIEERRRQLFLQGHRIGDMLRYNLPFPTGFDHKGRPYSTETCLPLPVREH